MPDLRTVARHPVVGFLVTLAVWLLGAGVLMPPIGVREVVIGVLVAGSVTFYFAKVHDQP